MTMNTTNLHPLAVTGPADYPTGSLVGYCRTTYATLIASLGLPHHHDIDGKVTVEWAFRCADGTSFHVYDWKEAATPKADYWWHIGGNGPRSLKAFARHTGLPISYTQDLP